MAISSERRLRTIAWSALEGIAPEVTAAIASVLSGAPAERVLDRLLRAHKQWSSEQRAAAAEAVFGVGLWRRRLAHHAGTDDPRGLLFALLRDLAGVPGTVAADYLGDPDLADRPIVLAPSDFATRFSLPDWIAALIQQELNDEAPAFADALNVPGPVALRANTLRSIRDELAAALASEGIETAPGRWAPDALIVQGRANLLGTKAHRDGWFEAQDEGSQLLGLLVDARPGETILDACAGAGGKTLLLAAAMRNEGTLYAFDPDRERLSRLEQRCSRAGVTCVRILWDGIPPDLRAHRVLVDAPCSELGALRRGPDLRWRLSPELPAQMRRTQLEILHRVAGHATRRLVYATCTFNRSEDEAVVSDFLRSHPDFRLTPPADLDPSLGRDGFFRCYPHLHGTDSFFGAVLERG